MGRHHTHERSPPAKGGRLDAPLPLAPFVDEFEPWDGPVGGDPLGFPGYPDALARARAATGCDEAVVTGRGTVAHPGGRAPVAVVATRFDVLGGSMGAAVGERVVRAYGRARDERLPVLVVAASGGARLQEGMVSLVQMARTADAARHHADAGLLQVAYLRSPTTGGVYASFASLADVLWAEPGATIGFAGPRVVEHTTGRPLPPGAHTAESAAAAGLVDDVIDAETCRERLGTLLALATPPPSPGPAWDRPPSGGPAPPARSAWEQVLEARHPDRPSGRWWLERLVPGPHRTELHGDRCGGRGAVVAAGLGRAATGHPVAYVALDRHTADGRPRPADFRLARRVLGIAARLGLPVVTIVDTPGADPSHESETSGVAGEIARTFAALVGHPKPTVALVVGEGGSGGALALAAADRMLMLEGSIFSVIGPEGAAAILHRDARLAPEVAEHLRLTAADLVELGIADAVVRAQDAAEAIGRALEESRPGDGRRRLDAATHRWLS